MTPHAPVHCALLEGLHCQIRWILAGTAIAGLGGSLTASTIFLRPHAPAALGGLPLGLLSLGTGACAAALAMCVVLAFRRCSRPLWLCGAGAACYLNGYLLIGHGMPRTGGIALLVGCLAALLGYRLGRALRPPVTALSPIPIVPATLRWLPIVASTLVSAAIIYTDWRAFPEYGARVLVGSLAGVLVAAGLLTLDALMHRLAGDRSGA